MTRRRLLLHSLSVFGVGAVALAGACTSLAPYPGDDPVGPYHAGYQTPLPSGGSTPIPDAASDGPFLLPDGEVDGGPVSLCAGCSLVAAAENPRSLTLDPTHVYWTQGMNTGPVPVVGSGSVMQASRSGGGAATVGPGLTGPLIVKYANGWLGWSAFSGTGAGQASVSVVNVGSSGTPTTPGASQNGAYGVALDSANVYWASNDALGNALIQSAPLSGGGVSSLGATISAFSVGGVAVNATSIYFAAYAAGGGGGIFQLPLTGGTPSELWAAGGAGHPNDVAVDGTNVYWTDYGTGTAPDGAVYSVPLGGGAVSTMATGITGPLQIALDSTNVYFTAYNEGNIYEEPIGTTSPVAIVTGLLEPIGIAADNADSNVYFTTDTQILAHAK